MAEVPFQFTADDATFIDNIEKRLMGAGREYRRGELSDAAGVDPEDTRRVWRALGFANSREGDIAFTERDLEALQSLTRMVSRQDLDVDALLGLARAFGRTTDRLAMWQTQVVAELLMNRDEPPADGKALAKATAEAMVDLTPELEALLTYAWRRNVGVALSRMLADAQPESELGVVRTVGFADLVSFTRLSRTLSESDLAALVMRFEGLASDIVSENRGAVVKTVGDEILFSHQDPVGAARIARALRNLSESDELIPRMRVGLSTGRVLARLGDIYGPTVNRAARLTNAAKAGQVLVDETTADLLKHDRRSTLRAYKRIDLAGIGEVPTWVLT